MRLDRLITLALVHPVRRRLSAVRRSMLNVGRSMFGADLRHPTSDFGSGVRSPWSRSPVVPVLMYHSISDAPEPGVSPYYQVNTSPARFREQMQILADNGYRTLTLTGALALLEKQKAESRKQKVENKKQKAESRKLKSDNLQPSTCNLQPVVLTFDDGFRDFYTAAFPVLKEFGFTATVFLPTAFIQEEVSGARCQVSGDKDQDHGSRITDHESRIRESSMLDVRSSATSSSLSPLPSVKGSSELEVESSTLDVRCSSQVFAHKQFLTWDQVRELHAAGIEFGSHTVSHPKLVELSWTQIELELQNSKLELETQLQKAEGRGQREECGSLLSALRSPLSVPFCYPYAFPQANKEFTSRFSRLLQTTGYTCCVTTEIGRNFQLSTFNFQPHRADPFRLKRLPVNSLDDEALFRAKLEGAYDWLAWPQAFAKRCKHLLRHSKGSTQRPTFAVRSSPLSVRSG